ncbi:MAG: hypothetical protein N3H31_02215 [Candidatus Nezhaarchaeota archaeon]|nr:hypothetical protein [Candidatus Nezhaarchaeota archaeon]
MTARRRGGLKAVRPSPRRAAAPSKGLGTIVGTVFFVAIFMGAFATLLFMLNQFNLYYSTAHKMAVEDWERIQERFVISSHRVSGGRLNLTVENQGPIGVRLVQLWVNNVTDNVHAWFPIEIFLNPAEKAYNVGRELYLTPGKVYEVSLVSSRGNKAIAVVDLTRVEYELPRMIHFVIFTPDCPPPGDIAGKDAFHIYVIQRSHLEFAITITKVELKFYDNKTRRDITGAFTLEGSTPLPILLDVGESSPICQRYRFDKKHPALEDLKGTRWVNIEAYISYRVGDTLVVVKEVAKLALVIELPPR